MTRLPAFDASEDIWNMADVYRMDYIKVKTMVARLLQPKRICEIGVYSGISALCFLEECPEAEYVGIDDLSEECGRGMSGTVVETTRRMLEEAGYKSRILIADSQQMESLPFSPYDLVHVDGDHSYEGARHDVFLAWGALQSGGHILIDNGHDANVCCGAFHAISSLIKGIFDWKYFDAGVGSILIRKP